MSEQEIWYEVRRDWITTVKVASHTDQTVMIDHGNNNIRRKARRGSYSSFFPTWQKAKLHLECLARCDLEAAHRRLDSARSRLAIIQAMKEPDNE